MRIKYFILAVTLFGFIALGVTNITNHNQKLELKQIELKDTSLQLKQLENKYDSELKKSNINEEELKKLQQEKSDLEKQLQARREEQQRVASIQVAPKVYADRAPTTGNCGDNPYKQYIYQHESGCDTSRWNSSGCYGIGQDCNSIVYSKCGASFTCQDEYFSKYAIRRYGSWTAAYDFWTRNSWW